VNQKIEFGRLCLNYDRRFLAPSDSPPLELRLLVKYNIEFQSTTGFGCVFISSFMVDLVFRLVQDLSALSLGLPFLHPFFSPRLLDFPE